MSGERAATSPGRLRWYAVARGLVELACRLAWRVEVVGREHIPATGPFVLAPVHRSNIDTLLAGCVTHRRVRFMGKDTMFRYGWSARLFYSLGAFPVQRGTPDREALRTCEAAVAAGEPVVLFPEGARQSGPAVQPLLDGAAFVAARAGVPIIPVGIGGSEWAMPKGKLPRPVKVVVIVGPPIEAPARTEAARVSRRQVTELSVRLRAGFQQLFDQAQLRAGRPYPSA